ncbi:MAG: BMP family ABC transporter substrate-binding protein [Clostridiales bacterium]|nr:BMP family ABC transporter substrate-binding protein [Clostridiales bacterium]
MKRKRILVLIMAIALVVVMAACGGNASGGGNAGGSPAAPGGSAPAATGNTSTSSGGQGISGANIAFILPADDTLGVNDKGWIQMTWQGVQNFSKDNGKTCTYYQPVDNSMQGYLDAMSTAINSGTEVIITLGNQPVPALSQAQTTYPKVHFIAVEPDGLTTVASNTFALFHQADQAGFLAGIAAVKGGFKNIGIITGLDIPPMNIWTYGYIQGINYAAGKLGITDIKVRHTYANTSAASPDVQALCASWYQDGCDLIIPMIAGGNNSLFAAADAANKPCFGADVDQSAESQHVLTSAIKHIELTVPDALATVYNGTFPGGTTKWYNVDDTVSGSPAVGLATATWRVPNYTVDQYQQDLANFKNDVDGVRSGLLTEDKVRTDPNMDAMQALWNAIPDKHIDLTIIKSS